ncbi:MAG TPA: hypothetical protein PKY26_09030 [Acetivibrio clariflavus]|nr:hypothetical protein [Acetivibrio clariflavus]
MADISTLSTLDKMRLDRGNRNLSFYFHKLLVRNPSKALNLINEDNLSFPALYILLPQISKPSLSRYLNSRNKKVIDVIKSIRSKSFSRFNELTKNIDVAETLKWILQTGKDDAMSRGEYTDILDSCAIILVREYKDYSILPVIKEIIYNRYKQGLFIHDMVWAFFECRDPNCILMLAEGFNSEDEKEVELTKELLKFIPVVRNSSLSKEMLYSNVRYWLKENLPFIYYTGESFQQMPDPSPFEVSLGAKYLFKKVSRDGTIEGNLTDDEKRQLNIFNTLDINSQILLSNYSFILHNQNIYSWNNWIRYPITEQLKISAAKLGGSIC